MCARTQSYQKLRVTLHRLSSTLYILLHSASSQLRSGGRQRLRLHAHNSTGFFNQNHSQNLTYRPRMCAHTRTVTPVETRLAFEKSRCLCFPLEMWAFLLYTHVYRCLANCCLGNAPSCAWTGKRLCVTNWDGYSWCAVHTLRECT